jgi:tetratricopeptide (TPR) repeat protein
VRWLLPQQALVAVALGDWHRAEELLAQYAGLISSSEGHYLEGQMHLLRASMAQARGDIPAALASAERSLAHSRVAKDPQALGPALAAYARVLVEADREEDAGPLVDELLTLTDDDGAPLYFGWLIDLGWLLHDLGRPEQPPPTPRSPVWNDAAQAIARGDLPAAADVLGGTELVSEEAYARLRAAEQLASQGFPAEAQTHLARALAFYRAVGAKAYVMRGEALLAASA